jgi:hypothetical protein
MIRRHDSAAGRLSIHPVRRYTVRMSISREQAARLYDALNPHVNYLYRLKERMEQRRLTSDPLYSDVCKAYDAAWRLAREAHSRSVGMGSKR